LNHRTSHGALDPFPMKISRIALVLSILAWSLPVNAEQTTPAPVVTAQAVETTSPVEEAVAKIQKLITQRLQQADAGETVPNRFDWTAAESELANIKTTAMNPANANEAKNLLRNLIRRIKSDELKQQLETLNGAIDEQKVAEIEIRRQKYTTQLTEISTAALKAKTAEEIDPLFDRVSSLEEDMGSNYEPKLNRIRNQISQAQNFLRQWQEFIDNASSGNVSQARQSLNNFRSNSFQPPGVSRSVFRDVMKAKKAELGGDAGVSSVAGKITLTNISDIQQQLLDGAEYGWNNEQNERNNLIASLDVFLNADQALKAGNADEAMQLLRSRGVIYGGARNSSVYPILQSLRNQWVIASLPQLSGIKALGAAKKTESALDYVGRLMLEADAKENWSEVQALAHVLQFLDTPITPSYISISTPNSAKDNPELAVASFRRGQLMEVAGQSAAAAELYRESLKQGATPKLQSWLVKRLRELDVKE
jgi:polyhydroxyalkanoate synthesis regulator phasin